MFYIDFLNYFLAFFISSDFKFEFYLRKNYLGCYMAKENEWIIVKEALLNKAIKIISNIRILSYFSISILFIGAAGIWLPWLGQNTPWESVFRSDNIFTFVVALLGGLLCNKIFHADRIVKSIFEELNEKTKNSAKHDSIELKKIITKRHAAYKEQLALSAFGLFVGAVIMVLVIVAYSNSPQQNNLWGGIGLILALFLYLFTSADDIEESTKVPEIANEDNEPSPQPFSSNKVKPTIFRDDNHE